MLKTTTFLSILVLFLLSQNALAQSPSLKIAEAFNILAVNGRPYSGGLIKQKRLLNLRSGKNLIALEYEEVFESEDDDNFDIVKSAPFLLEIYLNQKNHYVQRLLKPSNVNAAKRFSQNPLFEVIQTSNKSKAKKLQFELRVLHSTSDSYLAQETRLRQNATLDLSHPSPKSSNIRATKELSKNTNQSMARKMLEYWWQQATPAERQEFLASIEK